MAWAVMNPNIFMGTHHNPLPDWQRPLVEPLSIFKVGGQAVLGRQSAYATPWLTERHGYDPTSTAEIG